MAYRHFPALLIALTALTLSPRFLRAESLPIFLDGTFGDWVGPVELLDPAGDGAGAGVDIRTLDLANDDLNLFVRFDLTNPIGIQDGINSLVLYLDTDLNSATGFAVGGMGADLEYRFGNRRGTFHTSGSTVFQDDIRLRQLPVITSSIFEISIGRNVLPDGVNPLFVSNTIGVLLVDEDSGDQAPDAGSTLTYSFDSTPVPAAAPINLARQNSTDVRMMTWNTRDLSTAGQYDPGATPSADRVISALNPDIICFQEVRDVSAAQTQALIEGFLPSGPGQAWFSAKQDDNIVTSRFPILNSWSVNNNLAVHLDATGSLGIEILLVAAHMPCCTNDSGRQNEADNMMAFFRDAMTPGGVVTLASGSAFIITGDLNLVGNSQQLTTLLTGNIANEATFGPDFNPDWDGTGLADVISRQTEARFAYSWRNDFSSFAPGRLDFVIFNDSAVELGNHFLLYSPEMSTAELVANGLQASDVITVSDHLPHIADFRVTAADVGNATPGNSGVTISSTTTRAGNVQFMVQLDSPGMLRIGVFDVSGRRIKTLRREAEGRLSAGAHVFEWDGRDSNSSRTASGAYFVRVVSSLSGRSTQESEVTTHKFVLLR